MTKALNITIRAGTWRYNRHQLANNLHGSTNEIVYHPFQCYESFQFEEVGDRYQEFGSGHFVIDGPDDQPAEGARPQVEYLQVCVE
jgi:hypothetical protein